MFKSYFRNITLGLLVLIPFFVLTSLTAQETKSQSVQASSSYVIRALDYLQFRVIGESDTEVRVRVSAEGTVSLPYVRSVTLEGLTVSQARDELYELYDGDYFINPQIDVSILAYSGRSVEVIGYVGRQGSIEFPAEQPLYLLEAISRAGGFQQLAKRNGVEITRIGGDGSKVTKLVDTTEITARDFPLEDGDIINVLRRVWYIVIYNMSLNCFIIHLGKK